MTSASTGSVGPGTLLAGRYRLEDLLTDSDGARFWRATDQILARSVAIHAVPSDDERAEGLMEAARVSATVADPHLLRVLDCDDADGVTWVVNEWGDGVSLDLMLQQGTLPPSRAAWLAREVAEAISAGHAQGVAHGRLNPEAVLVTHAGSVKLIGYAVDASLERARPTHPLYGDLDAREADVINLAGILYAALTGRWPGVTRSQVPDAPRDSRHPLRPRQVRAGVPRTLDAICDRVLNTEGSRHVMPIETAFEIAAALSDYVGNPALVAPGDAAGMHSEPTVTIPRGATVAAGVDDLSTVQPVVVPTDPDATQLSAAVRAVDPRDEGTRLHREPLESPDDLRPLHRPTDPHEQVPPPPPFEEIPDRPLFASTDRRVPTGASSTGTGPGLLGTGGHDLPRDQPDQPDRPGPPGSPATGTTDSSTNGFWPFTDDAEEQNDVHTGKEGRGWLRTAIVVAVLLVVVIAMAIAFNRGRGSGSPRAADRPTNDTSKATAVRSVPLKIAGVRDFDPYGDPPEENPQEVSRAVDGDPSTSWTTLTYRGNPALGGLKPGVGLMLDLGRDLRPSSLTVRLGGTPTSVEVYAATPGVTTSPDSLDQLDKVAARADAGARVTLRLQPRPTTRYLLVWLTRLPPTAGGFRGEISGITVRS